MELQKIYNLIDESDIFVAGVRLDKHIAFSMSDNGNMGIGIDYSKIENSAMEKSVLMEEFYHHKLGLTYKLNDIKNPLKRQNIERCECQAKQKSAAAQISFSEFKLALKKGLTESWEIAEYFNISEDVVKTAVNYYQTKGMFKITK